MKHTATLEDANHSLDEAVSTLQNHLSKVDQNEPEQLKLANEYYKWTTLKTNLILNEKSFQIPPTALPNIIKPSSFKWLRPEKQAVVSKYYRYDKETDTYVISVKKQSVPCEDIEMIARSLVLIRKAVVWVDFGYNIGTEFGGRHPAIILKNLEPSSISLYKDEIESWTNLEVSVGKIVEGKIPILDVKMAKGMEFRYVVVDPEEMTENDKYIAYTRAMEKLYIVEE